MMVFRSVVLPTPFRPMRHTTPPAGTSRDTSQSTWLSPYATFRPRTSSIGVAAAPQVDLHHPLVALHLVDRALAQHATLVEHRDGPRDAAHELHVMLDHEHRTILRDAFEEAARLLGLLIGHSRYWLVDHEELGILDHDHADLEPLLLAVGESAGALARVRGQADGLQDGVDALTLGPAQARLERGKNALARARQRQLEVLPHGELGEDRRRLELAAHPKRCDLVLPSAHEV